MFPLAFIAGYVVTTPLTLLVIGLFFAIMLTIAHHRLKVEVDPRITAVRDNLPGANCGGCGYASCDQLAEEIVQSGAEPTRCAVLSEAGLKAIAKIMGIEASAGAPKRAVVHCGARSQDRLARAEYRGARTCLEMNLVGGVQGCTYGCLGLGDCVGVCPFEAIWLVDGLPVVDYEACTGCGNCVQACPRGIITIETMIDDPLVTVACSSRDAGKVVRENCACGCIGCGICEKLDGPTFKVEGNLCRLDYTSETYGQSAAHTAAMDKCPTFCLRQVGTQASDPYALFEKRRREKAEKAAKAKAAAAAKQTNES